MQQIEFVREKYARPYLFILIIQRLAMETRTRLGQMVRKKSVGMEAASTPAKINDSVASDRQSWICDLYEAPSMNREHESM